MYLGKLVLLILLLLFFKDPVPLAPRVGPHFQEFFQCLGIYIQMGQPCTERPASVSCAVFSAVSECSRGLTRARFILGKIKARLPTVSRLLQLAKLIANVHAYFSFLAPADLSTLHSHLPSSHLEGEICKLQHVTA